MISLGGRDGSRGIEHGFSSGNNNRREIIEESEVEEGEACSFIDNNVSYDPAIDPDVALSYIDEKLQNLLGHCQKDFEGLVSVENLGAKFGHYGSFLPTYRRSPVLPHSRNPQRAHNHRNQESPSTVAAEDFLQAVKHGSASSNAYKPTSQNDGCLQNARARAIQEQISPLKSEVRDQRTLKVRIKVGSDNLSVKKNSAIYSGLGLDGYPPSFDDYAKDSRKLSHGLASDSFESPSEILRMMTSFPLFGGRFLSPLSDYLIHLSERPDHLHDTPTQASILRSQHLSLQDKRDDSEHNGGFLLKESNFDTVSCDMRVSNTLKLPLLCDSYSNKKQDVYFGAEKNLGEKPTSMVEANKNETASPSVKLNDHVKPRIGMSARDGVDVALPSRKEQLLSGGKKKTQNGQINGAGKGVASSDKLAQVPKGGNHSDTNITYSGRGSEMLKLSSKGVNKGKNRYADFFGDLNDLEDEVTESTDVFSKEVLNTAKVVEKATLTGKVASNEMVSSVEAFRDATSRQKNSLDGRGKILCGTQLYTPSHSSFLVDNDRTISDPAIGTDPEEWAECDKCRKWRLLPPGIRGVELPEEWDCSMQTWLHNMNGCGINAEETDKVVRDRYHVLPDVSNSFHVPCDLVASGTVSVDSMNPIVPYDESMNSKPNKTSKLSVPENLDRLLSSSREKKSAKSSSAGAVKNTQQTRSSDVCRETTDRKQLKKQQSDRLSDGGTSNIPTVEGNRMFDQGFPRTSNRSKTQSLQSGGCNLAPSLDNGNDMFIASSAAGKDQVRNVNNGSLQNVKDQMAGTSHDVGGRFKCKFDDFPSDIGNIAPKKRKWSFEDCPNSTLPGKVVDDNEHANNIRKRLSKSYGKETSSTKRSSKPDKKRKSISNHITYDNKETGLKVSLGSDLAATSSSSKVSCSLKVKSKFQDLKGSPIESVSSSPVRSSHFDKLSCKDLVEKDNVQDHVKPVMGYSQKSVADNDSSRVRYSHTRKDAIEARTDRKSLISSMIDLRDKNKEVMRHKNGDLLADSLEPQNGCPSTSLDFNRGVNERERGENSLHYTCNKDKNLTSKFSFWKSENDPLCGSMTVHEERERDEKISVPENFGCNVDKFVKHTVCHEDLAYPSGKRLEEYDEKISSLNVSAAVSDHLKSRSPKEKLECLAPSDVDAHEISDIPEQYQGSRVISSFSNPHQSNLPKAFLGNKKAEVQNRAQYVSSKQSVSNGHIIKHHDASSPQKRDSFSQAASSSIKEAKNLKHLADRIKNADPAESTGLYFEAALKFLHGASLLESGRIENAKNGDVGQATQMYSDTAKLCRFCAHEYEKSKDMVTAALAYKCMEVAYLRVVYSSHNTASRDRFELQTIMQVVPPGESPSSSASDIDNLNNATTGDKAAQPKNFDSPQLAGNLVLAARNHQNFSRLLSYIQRMVPLQSKEHWTSTSMMWRDYFGWYDLLKKQLVAENSIVALPVIHNQVSMFGSWKNETSWSVE